MKFNTSSIMALAMVSMAAVASSASAATTVNVASIDPAGTTISLGAGTYDVSEVSGLYTAYSPWGVSAGVSCNSPSDCVYGFRSGFDISINGGPGASYTDPGVTGMTYQKGAPTYDTAADSLAAFQAYESANPISFTLAAPSTVSFYSPDTYYADNTGGVSLSVSAAPEPSTWALMIAGVGLAGFALRRKPQAVSALA